MGSIMRARLVCIAIVVAVWAAAVADAEVEVLSAVVEAAPAAKAPAGAAKPMASGKKKKAHPMATHQKKLRKLVRKLDKTRAKLAVKLHAHVKHHGLKPTGQLKKIMAIARLNAAKEMRNKKKEALQASLKALAAHEKLRREAARKAAVRAKAALKARHLSSAANETRLNRQRFIKNYVRKAKADVMSMKIVNPLAGSVKKAARELNARRSAHEKDQKQATKDAYAAAHAAGGGAKNAHAPHDAHNLSIQKTKKGKKKAKAAQGANNLRKADLTLSQQIALTHVSKMEVIDAESTYNKQKRLYSALQTKLRRHRKKLADKAVKKAKLEAPKVWADDVRKMKANAKRGGNTPQQPARPHPVQSKPVVQKPVAKKKRTETEKMWLASQKKPVAAPKVAKPVAAPKVAKPVKMAAKKPASNQALKDKHKLQKKTVNAAMKKAMKPSKEKAGSKYKARKTTNKAKKSVVKTVGIIARAMRDVDKAKNAVSKAGASAQLAKKGKP